MAVRLSRLALVVGLLLVSCSTEDGERSNMSPRQVAAVFAKAMVADDFEGMRALLCVSQDPTGLGDFQYQSARVIGPAGTEPPTGQQVVISDPAPDFYVPFKAKTADGDLLGSVNVTLGPNQRCVMSYSAGPVSA